MARARCCLRLLLPPRQAMRVERTVFLRYIVIDGRAYVIERCDVVAGAMPCH